MLMLKTIRSKYGAVVGALVLLMVFLLTVRDKVSRLYFFPRVTLLTFFSILVVWGLGFLRLGSWIGFFGLRFLVDGVWGLWCGAFWVC